MALYLHEDAKELLAGKTIVVIGDSGKKKFRFQCLNAFRNF